MYEFAFTELYFNLLEDMRQWINTTNDVQLQNLTNVKRARR